MSILNDPTLIFYDFGWFFYGFGWWHRLKNEVVHRIVAVKCHMDFLWFGAVAATQKKASFLIVEVEWAKMRS